MTSTFSGWCTSHTSAVPNRSAFGGGNPVVGVVFTVAIARTARDTPASCLAFANRISVVTQPTRDISRTTRARDSDTETDLIARARSRTPRFTRARPARAPSRSCASTNAVSRRSQKPMKKQPTNLTARRLLTADAPRIAHDTVARRAGRVDDDTSVRGWRP